MILLVLLFAFGTVLYYALAVRRGETRFTAAFWAILLGPFALPFLLLPPRRPRSGHPQS